MKKFLWIGGLLMGCGGPMVMLIPLYEGLGRAGEDDYDLGDSFVESPWFWVGTGMTVAGFVMILITPHYDVQPISSSEARELAADEEISE